nr:dNTP triphosphohydrolase [uncultured Niameybacter sp.]
MINREEIREKRNGVISGFGVKNDMTFLTKRIQKEEQLSSVEVRESFQRDRDRIIHSRAFRRLMHKTQIFNANMGDHYRNRLTHTLEVSQIARSIGKVLGLNDELIEAISLGHDLGHTPFGHIGERTLHMIISGRTYTHEEMKINNLGGFKHNFQGLHLVDNLETCSNSWGGMNLTLAVREGILKHTDRKIKIWEMKEGEKVKKKEEVNYECLNMEDINIDLPSFTLEGQVVAIADEIAQCTHDLEDGIRSGIITLKDIQNCELVKKVCEKKSINLNELNTTVEIRNVLIKTLVGFLIEDVCNATFDNLEKLFPQGDYPKFTSKNDVYTQDVVKFSKEVSEDEKQLSSLKSNLVIMSQQVSQADSKAEYLIKKIFKAYFLHPQQLPDYILKRYFIKKGRILDKANLESEILKMQKDTAFVRLICDHISGMTDQFVAREYKKLFEAEHF